MKRLILIAISSLIIGAAISPVLGMAITPTRNLILGLAPEEAILALADKIDDESEKNEEQAGKINEQEQKIDALESKNTAQEEALLQQQERTNCELKKRDCEDKVTPVQKSIDDNKKTISRLKEETIPNFEKEIAKCPSGTTCHWPEDRLKDAKDNLREAEQSLVRSTVKFQELMNGECKNYQDPC